MADIEKVIYGINKILEETDEYDGVLWDALELLKEQQKIIDRYHQADTFLDAHGWKWKDGEQDA